MREMQIRGSLYKIKEDGTITSHLGRKINTWVENNAGYHLFRVRYEGNVEKCFRLHRILAECFIPNPDNLPFVKHKDDDKDNNTLDNLEWGANPDNTQEGYDNACYQYNARCHKVKATCLTTGKITIAKSLRSLSEELGLNRKNIAAILKGKKNNTYNYSFEYYEMD